MNASRDEYATFARFYDLEYDEIDADLDFYRMFAAQANGPILELGCGSGRVLAALEETGLPLTGIDTSNAMLEIARSRLSPDTHLIEADMRRISPSVLPVAPVWMAFSAINTFLHLPAVEDQLTALMAIRSVLAEGGLLLLDLMLPDAAYIAGLDGRLAPEFSTLLPDGSRLDKWVSRTHDHATQTIDTLVYFDVCGADDGRVTRIVDRYLTRYIHRFELEHLLERTGFTLLSLYGSYDLEPFDSGAERMIALATWGAASERWEG